MARGRKRTCSGIALALIGAAALAAGPSQPPPAGRDTYYLVVYAAQDRDNNPENSHCFATFARVAPGAGSAGGAGVELVHINWFSVRGHRTGSTRGLVEADGRPARPEPGENRTTREALLLAHRHGLRVTRWGPYAIDRELFERAGRQAALLEGRVPGRTVQYKALDLGYREGAEVRALNCIHAISDVVREPAPLRTWTTYGDEAARRVVGHFRGRIQGTGAEAAGAWGPIWAAIWRDAPAPARLGLVRGDPPWRRRSAPTPAGGTIARAGDGPEPSTREGGG